MLKLNITSRVNLRSTVRMSIDNSAICNCAFYVKIDQTFLDSLIRLRSLVRVEAHYKSHLIKREIVVVFSCIHGFFLTKCEVLHCFLFKD